MLTLHALCAAMEHSDRYLSPRAARDWWTKGLLPRPCRHGLGRGKGTETFWTDPRVSEQAQAAYDLLSLHPRTDLALVGLWLLGFPVSLRSIRAVYRKLINRDLRSVHGRAGRQPDDILGKFAEVHACHQARESAAPVDARQALTDLSLEFLAIFYEINSELATEGLAELWEKAAPCIGGAGGSADLHLRDEDIAVWAHYVQAMASLNAQRKMIRSASDYELVRARRLVLFVFGYLRRILGAVEDQSGLEEFGRRLLIVLGRPAVPILVAILRNDALRHRIMSSLLEFMLMLPGPAEWAGQMRVAHSQAHHQVEANANKTTGRPE